jgi:hypothetical protein
MDGSGWIFIAMGNMEVPGIGGAQLSALFGNYSNMAEHTAKIGAIQCLPAGFNQHLKGFFLSGGITKQILPKISHNYGIVSVEAGLDLNITARVFMNFGAGGNIYGLGALATGCAYAGGSVDATCTSASASATVQIGVSGDYNTATSAFNINGCGSVALKFSAEQCLPVLIGCSSPCISVNLIDMAIGANINMNSQSGFSMGITTTSCDQQCH